MKFVIELEDCIPNRLFDYLKKMNPACKKCDTDPETNPCVCNGTCQDYKKCNTAFKVEQRKKNTKPQSCNKYTKQERKERYLRCKTCDHPTTSCLICKKCPYFGICREMYKNAKAPKTPPQPKQPRHPFPWKRIPKDTTPSPTAGQGRALTLAFDHFNKELFAGELTRPMLTLSRNPVTKLGYFSPLKWYNPKGEHAHELGLNANLFFTHDIILFYTCFIHEMIHIFQYDISQEPGQPGEHNAGFLNLCKIAGLKTIPQPGGNLHTELIEGGKAYKAILTLPKECTFPYMSHPSAPDGTPIPIPIPVPMPGETAGQPQPSKGGGAHPGEYMPGEKDRTPPKQKETGQKETVVNIPMTGKRAKYTCPVCGLNAWAKPGAGLTCSKCCQYLVEVKG